MLPPILLAGDAHNTTLGGSVTQDLKTFIPTTLKP
jgi:hypothetical protein